MNQNNFYVYAHFLLTGEVFYIGKGKGRRAYTKDGRNPHWKNKVAKYGGFIVSILQDQLDEELAFEIEKSFIESIGRENLVNMTDGGEGTSGCIPSEETRKKQSESHKGLFSGYKNPLFGKKHSEEHRRRHSDSIRGDKNPMFGKKHSEETRKKQSEIKIGLLAGDKHPLFGKFGSSSPCAKKVNQYTKDGELIKTWDSMIDASRELGIQHSNISACCRGVKKSAGGYIWRFA